MNKYTKREILEAAKIGEVSMIDARHIVGLLDYAKQMLNKKEKNENNENKKEITR
jgi:hypothetical protein